jgi:hypothetical protein
MALRLSSRALSRPDCSRWGKKPPRTQRNDLQALASQQGARLRGIVPRERIRQTVMPFTPALA